MRSIGFFIIVSFVFAVPSTAGPANALQTAHPKYKAKSFGVPAAPDEIKYTQPDGSVITYFLKGDGAVNWKESVDGYPIVKNADGFYEYADPGQRDRIVPSGMRIRTDNGARSAAEANFMARARRGVPFSSEAIERMRAAYLPESGPDLAFPSAGTRKLLVLLVKFPDSTNTFTQSQFNDMMNTDNYNGVGSFRQYYYENSYGTLTLVSTVSTWYTAPQVHNYYGDNVDGGKTRARQLVRDMVDTADKYGVDFSQFDNDNDGTVDGVMVIHQGDGAEQGNSTNIWSHSWSLGTTLRVQYDGVYINPYTINPETRPGKSMNGIGVLCHEFGHNLGLPDFYDTDYENSGGTAEALGRWDCMDQGAYNNSSRSPPYHNSYSKSLLNWLTITQLSTAGSYSLLNFGQNPAAYYYTTTTANEYFILENRQNIGFDSYVPGHGMIIYHADGSYLSQWPGSNCINCNPAHQGLDLEEADATKTHDAGDAFPGTMNKSVFADGTTPGAKSWAGANTGKPVYNITESSQTITFNFMSDGPIISNVTHTPATPTYADNVQISAAIMDIGTITSASVAWCTDGTSFGNTIAMSLSSGSTYVSATAIPAQTVWTTVSYRVTATNNTSKTTTSPVYSYTIFPAYCAATSSTCNEYIFRLRVGTIDHSSTCGKYQDFTSFSADLHKNADYPITIDNGAPRSNDQCGVWADWNQDGIFTAGEKITVSGGPASFTGTINPPGSASLGKTRLRVRIMYTGTLDPCGTASYGEVEDYSINVISEQYQLSVTAGSGGTITAPATSPVSVDPGAITTITAAPGTGYNFVNWTVESGSATISSPASASTTVTLSSGDAEIKANFAIKTYELTVSAGSGGIITAPSSSPVTVEHGASTTITAAPGAGYDFAYWTMVSGVVTIGSLTSASTTVALSSGDAEVKANFTLKTYELTVTAGTGGTITAPSGSPVIVDHGAATTISAAPKSDSSFVKWTVTSGTVIFGDSTSASTTVTLSSGDAEVKANFALKTYELTVTAGTGGTITAPPSSPVIVDHGAATTITAAPESDSNFVKWTVTSGTVTFGDSTSASTTVTLRSGDAGVKANFAIKTYQLTVTAGTGGTITAPSSSPVTVDHGETDTIAASANSGYFFTAWTLVSGGATIADPSAPMTTVTLTSNSTIRADFVRAGSITVTISSGDGSEEVFLYATNGWLGRKVRAGSGTITDLRPGNYLLAIKDERKRTEYAPAIVSAGSETPVAVTMRGCVQQIFDSARAVNAGGVQISAGSAAAAVMDDFDGDGDVDLLIGRAAGNFIYYSNSASGYSLATGPRMAGGGDLSWDDGIRCLRSADWNADNHTDLLTLDDNGKVVLFKQVSSSSAVSAYNEGEVIYSAAGATAAGFDCADLNSDGFPDLFFGYANGEIKIAKSSASFSWSAPSWETLSNATQSDHTTAITAGSNAMPCVMEVTGDGAPDLVVGNGSGSARLFRNRGDGTWLDRGNMVFAGKALALSGSATVAAKYGAPGSLPGLVLVNGNGAIYSAQAVLAGDLNATPDGTVDLLDLQIFGDAWGEAPGAASWKWNANLDLSETAGDQVINILDLSNFADSWGSQK
jgi:M6 family metalloprotease-like protein